MRVALGVVDIAPSVVTPELADAALASPALFRAIELANWIGGDKELTASGTLRPVDAAEACRALGIELPSERLGSAGDAPELARVWEVARDAGFITVAGEHVRGSGLDDVTSDAEAAL